MTKPVDITAATAKVIALLEESGRVDLQRIADRMKSCRCYSLPLVKDNEGDDDLMLEPDGMLMRVGCRVRLCWHCNAVRRGRFDRRFRPQIQALQDLGHTILFVTLTRKVIYSRKLRRCFNEFRKAFSGLRVGRSQRAWWDSLTVGGLYCLENTMYGRWPKGHPFEGQIRHLPGGIPDRRNHVHLHAVLVVKLGVDPERAKSEILQGWVDQCEERGWYADPAAQKLEVVSSERLADGQSDDPLSYIVKYMSKPEDVVNLEDAIEVLEGCANLRTVNALGCLHGTALLATKAAAAVVPEVGILDEDKRTQTLLERAHETAQHVATAQQEAADVTESQGRDAAHDDRRFVRTCTTVLDVITADFHAITAAALRDLPGTDRRALAAIVKTKTSDQTWEAAFAAAKNDVEKRRQLLLARAHTARLRIFREHGAVALWSGRVARSEPGDLRVMGREKRLASAERRLAEASVWLSRCVQWSKQFALFDDGGRATVHAVRRQQATGSKRWSTIKRDDMHPAIYREAHLATGGPEADVYIGTAYATRAATEEIAACESRHQSAHKRLIVIQNAHTRNGKVDFDTCGEAMAVAIAQVSETATELATAIERERQIADRMPITVDVLRYAAHLGDVGARSYLITIEAGEAAREARRALRDKEKQERRAQRHGGSREKMSKMSQAVPNATGPGGAQSSLPLAG